jgi:hypothetical protein
MGAPGQARFGEIDAVIRRSELKTCCVQPAQLFSAGYSPGAFIHGPAERAGCVLLAIMLPRQPPSIAVLAPLGNLGGAKWTVLLSGVGCRLGLAAS